MTKRGKAEAAAERRAGAWELRKAGKSYRQIGRALGVSECQAHRDVHRTLSELAAKEFETARYVRDLELHRLDDMLDSLWPSVKGGDATSVNSALKISERRAKLLGLDAAAKTELTGADGGPLAIAQQVDLTKISDHDLATLAEILERAGTAGR